MLAMADRGSNPVCSICTDELVDREAGHYVLDCVRTPCNHYFHRHCIVMWLNRPGIGTCPNCRLQPLHPRDLVPVEKPFLASSRMQPLHQRAFVPVPLEYPLLGTSSGCNIQSLIWKGLNSGASILTRCWYFFEDYWGWFLLGGFCYFIFCVVIPDIEDAAKKAHEAKALPFLQRLSNRFEKYGFDKIDSWHAY